MRRNSTSPKHRLLAPKRIMVLFVALALVAAACGGSDSGDTDTTEAPTTTEATGSTEAPETTTTAAATTTTEAAPEPTTLTIMHYWAPDLPQGQVLLDVFDTVMKENPWITIEDEVVDGNGLPVKVTTLFVGGEEPDVVLQNLKGDTLVWPEDGITVPVTDLAEEWDFFGPFKQEARDLYTSPDGELIAFPLHGYSWPIWYNTEILDAAGVGIPTTIDELKEAIPKIKAAGFAPFVAAGSDWPGHQFFNLVLGEYMTDEEIISVYPVGGFGENANAVKGAELFVELRDLGMFSDDSQGLDAPGMIESFFAGEAAMAHLGGWEYANAPEGLPENIQLGGFPRAEDSTRDKPVAFGGFDANGVWITRNGADNIAAVQKFVEVLYRPEFLGRLVSEAGQVPPIAGPDFDPAALNDLFVKSLEIEASNPIQNGLFRDPEVGNPAYLTSTEIAYENGVSAAEILQALDNLFK